MRAPQLVGRIVWWQTTMMIGSWLVLVVWLFHTMAGFENGDLDRRMSYFAAILAEAASGSSNDPDAMARRVRATERIFVTGVIETLENSAAYTATYQIVAADGRLLFRTPQAAADVMAVPPGISRGESKDGRPWRYARMRSTDGRITAIVAESESARWWSILPMLRIIGGAQLLILMVTIGITWVAARRGLRPLQDLAARMGRRTTGDLSPIDVPKVYAETRPIIVELNALLDREARRLDNERGFLADAAHELRTPLAAVGTQAHLLLTAADAAEREHAGRNLRAGLERVSHLLAQLLTIARLDATSGAGRIERVDVAALLRERLAEFASAARRRSVSVELVAPDELFAQVDRAGIISVIDNLVDNAVRYAPGGGHVDVALQRDHDAIELVVRDDGPGIPAAERERVFERFYRIPGAAAPGSGLGLAIVRRVAQAHSASVQFVDGLFGAGIGVVVRLPEAAAGQAAVAASAAWGAIAASSLSPGTGREKK